MTMQRVPTESHPYIYVDRECGFSGDEIAQAMASGFGEVYGFISKNDIKPVSMPMSFYPEMPKDQLKFRTGFLVTAEDAAKASLSIQSSTLPPGEAMMSTHVGPYAGLGASHKALWDEMTAQGITQRGEVWEIYVDDPQLTPEESLRTEIYRSILTE